MFNREPTLCIMKRVWCISKDFNASCINSNVNGNLMFNVFTITMSTLCTTAILSYSPIHAKQFSWQLVWKWAVWNERLYCLITLQTDESLFDNTSRVILIQMRWKDLLVSGKYMFGCVEMPLMAQIRVQDVFLTIWCFFCTVGYIDWF